MFGLFSGRTKREAHMGGENTLYYNEEQKRWVERGKEDEAKREAAPPPPPTTSLSSTERTPIDEGNPASRYVPVGGFVHSATPPTEGKNAFVTPPPLSATAPPSGEFFIPNTPAVPAPQPTSPVAEKEKNTVKYKGYSIPTFTKPEGSSGTQEEYETEELRKFKARIDRREARKNGEKKTSPGSDTKENGILYDRQKSPGNGKLDNSWLTENGGDYSFYESYTAPDPFQQQAATDHEFGTETVIEETPITSSAPNDAQPLELFAVKEHTQQASGYSFDLPITTLHTSTPDPDQHQTTNSTVPPLAETEEPINFDDWDQYQAQNSLQQPQQSVEANGYTAEVVMSAPEGETSVVEYAGAVRETEDPYDITWLTAEGWTNHDECLAITSWLYNNYGDSWRSYPKSEEFWSEFWEWYYEDGFDIVHGTTEQQTELEVQTFADVQPPTQQDASATEIFNAGLQQEAVDSVQTDQITNTVVVESQPATETSNDGDLSQPASTVQPEGIQQVDNQGVMNQPEVFVPEDDEDFWNEAGGDADELVPANVDAVETAEQATEIVAMKQIAHTETPVICPVSTGKKSTSKLSSWEDELLFSLPDPWTTAPSSDDGMDDDARLPFAVFNHDGMLQFLHKLDDLFTDLTSTNNLPSSAIQFHQKVKELKKTVQISCPANAANPFSAMQEMDDLRHELDAKALEIEFLKSQTQQKDIEWNSKVIAAEQESAELRNKCQLMSQTLQEQEQKIQDLNQKLVHVEAEFDQNKERLSAAMTQLESKDHEVRNFSADIAEKQQQIEALHEDLRRANEERNKIQSHSAAELDNMPVNKSPSPSGVQGKATSEELRSQILDLEEELERQKLRVSEKDDLIARLTSEADQENGVAEGNNEVDTDEELINQLGEMQAENAEMKKAIDDKETRIADLEANLVQVSSELQSVKQAREQGPENEDLRIRLDAEMRKTHRLEQIVQDKEAEISRLTVILDSQPKKDGLISKLTNVLGEKDAELTDLRTQIRDGREREMGLIEQVSAKDDDLENVVHSLIFSQQQVAKLTDYCRDLGGDPHPLLSSVNVSE